MLQVTDLAPARPPCSLGERDAADTVQRKIRAAGLRPSVERVRAPTSPTWAPLLRALLRVWGAAFFAAGVPYATIGLAAASILGGFPSVSGLVRFVPLLGASSRNIVAARKGTEDDARPIIVAAHLDSHPATEVPMRQPHAFVSAASGWLALIAAVLGQPPAIGWRPAAALVAGEAVFTIAWLARQELRTPTEVPDDNTSGLLALVRLAHLLMEGAQRHDIWLVATGAGTSGSYGIRAFLKRRPDLRKGWVVEIDSLGEGEVIAAPLTSRFPHPGTPTPLVRAVVAAARASGDPLTVRRIGRRHSEARAALRMRVGAITLTGGLRPPAGSKEPDQANAERAARVVDRLARAED